MSILKSIIVAGALVAAAPSAAAVIAVANASFETQPAGGLPFGGCGTGCSYSIDVIPGWINNGATGQFQPGSSSGNFAYFDYVPDGLTVAYSNNGSISQTVAATAVAGTTYTLLVDLGWRHDYVDPGTITLFVGGVSTLATGIPAAAGQWSTYTASYTALAADAGGAISVLLYSPGAQGDFDNVRLYDDAAAVPEPAAWALMLAGFAVVGVAARRRRTAGVAA